MSPEEEARRAELSVARAEVNAVRALMGELLESELRRDRAATLAWLNGFDLAALPGEEGDGDG